MQTHNYNLELQVSPNLLSNNCTLPKKNLRLRWPRASGQRTRGQSLTLPLLSAAAFGHHQDPPLGVTFIVHLGPGMTSQLIQ